MKQLCFLSMREYSQEIGCLTGYKPRYCDFVLHWINPSKTKFILAYFRASFSIDGLIEQESLFACIYSVCRSYGQLLKQSPALDCDVKYKYKRHQIEFLFETRTKVRLWASNISISNEVLACVCICRYMRSIKGRDLSSLSFGLAKVIGQLIALIRKLLCRTFDNTAGWWWCLDTNLHCFCKSLPIGCWKDLRKRTGQL